MGSGFGRLVLAGFVATFAMTLSMFPSYGSGIAKLDFATLLGTALTGQSASPFSTAWWWGMAEHVFNGSVLFPIIFAGLVGKKLRGPGILRGLQWGIILWAALQAIVMPVAGYGFFSSNTSEPGLFLLASLIGNVIYGLLFGAIAGIPSQSERDVDVVTLRQWSSSKSKSAV